MIITAQKYTENQRDEWQQFIAKANNSTMFHSMDFLAYHPDGRFDFHHIIFRDESERIVAVLPGGSFKNREHQYWSPVGASYGGFVSADLPFDICLAIVDSFIEYIRGCGYKEAYIIPPPFVYSTNINQHFEYAMLYRKSGFELHYISHAIDLKHGEDSLSHFDKTARKTIRKILREGEIEIRDSDGNADDYKVFHRILVENKAKHNATPTHTLEELLRLQELLPENLRLMLVYYKGEPIAGSLLFLANKNVVLCFYNMLLYQYEYLKPVYLIMYETVRRAVDEGYKWVDIGVSQDTKDPNPMTPSLGLINFKERFFARGILRTTYQFDIGT
jgi:hypothetical protein